MATRAEILNGANFEGWEDWCADVVNAIKNHYRVSDPVVNMIARQPGEILSDPDDDKLYHVGGASGYPCDEILQATRSCDVIPEFKGVDFYDVCDGDYARIVGIDEPGLGHRLTIGLDETTRIMAICDLGDVDVDLGLGAQAQPTFYVFSIAGSVFDSAWLEYRGLHLDGGITELLSIVNQTQLRNYGNEGFLFEQFGNDIPAEHLFRFVSAANIELTDTNAEQAWVYIEPKVRQTLTAGYIAILVDVTEESLGDGSAGAGYNALLDLRVAGTTQFGIQNDGKIMTNQVNICSGATPGTLNGELPVYDDDGILMGYVAVYSSICP